MTDVEGTRELHTVRITEDQWWACQQPERPAVPRLTVFDVGCVTCMLSMRAAIETGHLSVDGMWELDDDGVARGIHQPAAVLEMLGRCT